MTKFRLSANHAKEEGRRQVGVFASASRRGVAWGVFCVGSLNNEVMAIIINISFYPLFARQDAESSGKSSEDNCWHQTNYGTNTLRT